MNNKALIAVVALVLIGGGYWFYVNSQRTGTDNTRLPQGSMAQDSNTVSDTSTIQAGGEAMSQDNPTMHGTWKSREDAKFTREFSADGMVTDRYQGDASATMTGTYMIVDPLKEPEGALGNVPVASLAGMTILRTTWPNGDIMYFGVLVLTNTELQLSNISGRGNTLAFTKFQ